MGMGTSYMEELGGRIGPDLGSDNAHTVSIPHQHLTLIGQIVGVLKIGKGEGGGRGRDE